MKLKSVFVKSLPALIVAFNCSASDPVTDRFNAKYARVPLPINTDYIAPVFEQTDIDLALSGGTRTWVAYNTEGQIEAEAVSGTNLPSHGAHMSVGHAFRTQWIGGDLYLIPLTLLRAYWEMEPNAKVKLDPIPAGKPAYYCGMAKLPHHAEGDHVVDHALYIRPTDAGPHNLRVKFEVWKDDYQCAKNDQHGGVIHIEN